MTSSTAALPVDVAVDGRQMLDLVVHGNGRDVDFDHVDWVDARVRCNP